jgi:hypothetical protein
MTREPSDIKKDLSDALDQQRTNAASGLSQVASKIRDKAENIPGGQKLTGMADTLASKLECTADYFRSHDFKDMRNDMMGVCRRYPVQSFVAALAVGFLVGRVARR